MVELAVVANELVEVELVVVDCSAVKLSSVEEPESRRFDKLVSPPVAVKLVPTVREPVKLAALEIV